MALPYEVVDVFTSTAFTGNPLAVVLDGQELTTAQMQAIAREFHLSETAFALPSQRADYRVRIFTPNVELPFAGHPSVGTAHTLARLGRIRRGAIVQECAAGLLPIEVGPDRVTLTGAVASVGQQLDPQPWLRSVGLGTADFAGTAPSVAGCGLEFCYLHVHDPAVGRARPDAGGLGVLLGAGQGGISVVSWEPGAALAHVRVFAAEMGIVAVDVNEDPATGSAALGLGVWLVSSGLLPGDGASSYTVHQGAELHRPSVLHCTVQAREGTVLRATVSGSVVPIAAGTIRTP